MTTDNPASSRRRSLAILGGGPAGLGAAHYAHQAGLPFLLVEAGAEVGGVCRTLRHGEFRFDSGAHRFLAAIPEVTAEIGRVMGERWRAISAPSQVRRRGRMIGFPIAPFDLYARLGKRVFARAVLSYLGQAARPRPAQDNFEAVAEAAYGPFLAREFLLNYSEKLWGLPCDRLSPAVAGKRLKGIDVRTFAFEALRGRKATIEMQDGRFLYPYGGIGEIWPRLMAPFAPGSVRTGARVKGLRHDGVRIRAVELDGGEVLEPDHVICTLPLPDIVRMLAPAPAPAVLDPARSLVFRSLRLVAFFLDKPGVTDNGTVYFPDAELPFTRVYEPRNRDAAMAPVGATSLVAEVPCSAGEPLDQEPDGALLDRVQAIFTDIGWIRRGEVLDRRVVRIPHAYPVLHKGVEGTVAPLLAHLERFENLTLTGRNARFEYTLIHDVIDQGRRAVARLREGAGPGRG
jgi:protoporphyrinogen oxidase